MDEYSEMVAVAKPVIYITVGELINTHKVKESNPPTEMQAPSPLLSPPGLPAVFHRSPLYHQHSSFQAFFLFLFFSPFKQGDNPDTAGSAVLVIL